mgnify:CR=1 FL=1
MVLGGLLMISVDWTSDLGWGIKIQKSVQKFLLQLTQKVSNKRCEQPGTTVGYRRRCKKSCTRFRDFRKSPKIMIILDQILTVFDDFGGLRSIGRPIYAEGSGSRARYKNSCVGTLENYLISNASSLEQPYATAASPNKVAKIFMIFENPGKSLDLA